ncbi:MAG: DUF4382 domain-containing protein [Gemmatimonadaceae bacterium]
MIPFRALRGRLLAGFVAAMSVVGFASCDSPTALRTGELTLLLTDAPGDVVTAVVTIDQIYLQPSEDSDAGRIILRDDDVTTNLLTLVDDTQGLIAGFTIPVGTYTQLRFVISGAYIEVEQEGGSKLLYASSSTYAGLPAGATVNGTLQMPSFAQTGLKVTLPGDAIVINEDETVTLVIDFDVSQSFGQVAGGSGIWAMTPVLTATPPTE